MRKMICFFLGSLFIILFSATSFADFMTSAGIFYDSRYYPEFLYELGGAEGHSGAYVHFNVAIAGYYALQSVNIKAKHLATDFEVTLKEAPMECVGIWPYAGVDQYFDVWMKPADWMLGDWEFTLSFINNEGVKGKEVLPVTILRFYYPPEPTGVQLMERFGNKWLAWNSIGDPTLPDSRHVEYRLVRLNQNSCITDFYYIRPTGSNINFALLPGNKVAVEIPAVWQPGDLIRIENRVYGSPGGVEHFGRGTRYVDLPLSLFGFYP